MLQELAPLNEGERVYEMNHHFIDVFPPSVLCCLLQPVLCFFAELDL